MYLAAFILRYSVHPFNSVGLYATVIASANAANSFVFYSQNKIHDAIVVSMQMIDLKSIY